MLSGSRTGAMDTTNGMLRYMCTSTKQTTLMVYTYDTCMIFACVDYARGLSICCS